MPMNHFGVVGLGTRKYQPDNEPVRLCEEMLIPSCDCCRIGPCKLCLTWTVDGVEKHGTAIGDGEEWIGSVGGIGFRAYWDQSYCTINVELDEELVWSRSLCDEYSYNAVTCRNWDGSVDFETYGGDEGVFEWAVTEYLQLARRKGSHDDYAETACARHFCGDCECTCPQLCVTVTGGDDCICTGVIPFSGDQCTDGTVTGAAWQGDVECVPGGDIVNVSVSLTRSDYDDACQISGTASGTVCGTDVSITMAETLVSNCKSLGASWTETIDGVAYSVSVRCLECGECSGIITECCPDIALNETLYVDFIQIAPGPDVPPTGLGDDCSCAAVTVPVYGGALIGLGNDEGIWYSELMGWPCPAYPSGPTNWRVVLACSAGVFTLGIQWYDNCIALARPGEPVHCNPVADASMSQTGTLECDPLEITFRHDDPGFLFPSGICEGNLTPAHMMAIVTE